MSIYEGYLSFGGNEIVNNSRTWGISHSARPCPMHWLKGGVCQTMNGALFEAAPYSYESIALAPWYDPDIPQSADFYGFFAYAITEALDSTRTVSRTESITDGGVLGRTRKATKTMRVKGLIMGRGRLGVEYGQAWLSSAIDPGACGQHGSECGLTDLQWFADCPPDRANVQEWNEWAETRRNLFLDPKAATLNSSVWGSTAGTLMAAISRTTDGDGTTWVGATRIASGTARILDVKSPLLASTTYRMRMRVRASADLPAVTVNYRPSVASTSGQVVVAPSATIPAGESVLDIIFTTSATAPSASGITFTQNSSALERMEVTEVMFESPATNDVYFDGSSPAVNDPAVEKRYSWSGATNASASIEERRNYVSRPQTDAEYKATVDGYVRYMHDVAAISGPIITNTLQAGDFYAYEVELVFGAERPWVYGISRDVDLPPTVPLVIQDIPYNLVPAPSAELASGDVVTARNLSPNPSVETNATDWTTYVASPITAAMISAARSTALAAVGAASYRVLFTASAAGTGGAFGAQQTVPITDALERHSINLWAALIPLAGASVLGTLQIVAYWQNAASTTLRTDQLGTVDVGGGVATAKSILPPAGATKVVIRAIGNMTSYPSGATVQLFADALAVTVP